MSLRFFIDGQGRATGEYKRRFRAIFIHLVYGRASVPAPDPLTTLAKRPAAPKSVISERFKLKVPRPR